MGLTFKGKNFWAQSVSFNRPLLEGLPSPGKQTGTHKSCAPLCSMPTHIFVWGYMYPQGLHLGVQDKIWGYTFWKSVIGVHTSVASRLIHGNSLYQSTWKFWPAEFSPAWIRHAFAKVYNFIVRLRLICPFRQLNLLCLWGFITVLRFMFFTPRENLRVLFYAISIWRRGFNHVVKHAVICDWTTLMNNLFPFHLCADLRRRVCIWCSPSDTNMSDS